MTLTASIIIDLTGTIPLRADECDQYPSEFEKRYQFGRREVMAAGLDDLPDGTRVVILVGNSVALPDHWALGELHRHQGRLQLDVRGIDADTIRTWHRAIRCGRLDVAS